MHLQTSFTRIPYVLVALIAYCIFSTNIPLISAYSFNSDHTIPYYSNRNLDEYTSQLSTPSLIQNGTAFLLNNNVVLTNQMLTLYWEFNLNNTVTFTLVFEDNEGWIGIGYGNNDLEYTDMTIAFISGDNLTINDYYTNNIYQSMLDTTLDCEDDIILIGYNITLDQTIITYQRALNTNDDQCDYTLNQNETMTFIWAYGNNSTEFNFPGNNMGNIIVNFTQNGIQSLQQIMNGTAFLPSSSYNMLLEDMITLYWLFNQNQTVTFTVIFNQILGWVGLGYGNNGMYKTDMTILNIYKNETIQINDYYSDGENRPSPDINLGCQDNIILIGYNITSCQTIVTYQRLLNTLDNKCDYILNQNDTMSFIWAYDTEEGFHYHGPNAGSVLVNFTNNSLPIQPTNGTAFLPPNSDEFDYGMITFYWMFNTNNTVTMALTFEDNEGWVGIGYGNTSMTNVDIAVIFINGTNVTINDYHSPSGGRPPLDTALGCRDDIILLGYNVTNKQTIVTFQRYLDTGDYKCDIVLSQNSSMPFIWAYNNESNATNPFPGHHSNAGSLLLDFTNASNSNNITNGSAYYPSDMNITLTSGFSMNWEVFENNNTIIMAYTFNSQVGWIGVGYNSETMGSSSTVADMTIATFSPDEVTLLDYYGTGDTSPTLDTQNPNCANNVELLGYNVTNSQTIITFQRQITPPDECDTELNYNPDSSISFDLIWAFGSSNSLSYHGSNKGAIQVNCGNGICNTKPLNDFQKTVTTIHAWFLAIGWGIWIDISIIFARYFKTWKYYILTHGITAGILILGTLFLEISMIIFNFDSTRTKLVSWHFILGLVFLGLLVLQIIGGLLSRFKIEGKKPFKSLSILKFMHRLAGYLIYLLAKVNVGIGIYFYNQGSKKQTEFIWALAIYYIVLISFKIIYEIIHQLNGKKAMIMNQNEESNEKAIPIAKPDLPAEKLISLLERNVPLSLINQEIGNITWCILDNKVYIITDLLHPGGNFIIENIKGREIGRFIYGAYGLEILGESTKHIHSSYALKALNKYYVGKVLNGYQILTDYDDMGTSEKMADSKGAPLNPILETSTKWHLVKRTPISTNIYKYEFNNPDLHIRNNINKLENLGKHFKISHVEHKSCRLYTVILCQGKDNIEFRQKLYKLIENDVQIDELINQLPANKPFLANLPLVIKRYPVSKAFSNYLAQIQISEKGYDGFSISGPYGLGLGLNKDSKGEHYIFAAGTGVLPFLDLFDILSRKLCYDIISNKLESGILRKMNIIDEELSNAIDYKNLKFKVFLSFREDSDFIGRDIVEKLCELNKLLGLDFFEAKIKSNSNASYPHLEMIQSRFDRQFISQNLKSTASRVFICGPPQFNASIYNDALSVGIKPDDILLV